MNTQAASTPVPLEDIVGPVAYFPYPVWQVVLAVVGIAIIIGTLIWFLFFRRKPVPPLTAREKARAALAAVRGEMESVDPYDLAIRISDPLRVFIEAETGLLATRQTSLEFLSSIRESNVFSPGEKAALSLFLEKVDLIKFARVGANEEEREQLMESAERILEERPETVATKEGDK